jgi:hypothetical protein
LQFEELKKLLKDKGISSAKWKVYLPTVAAGVTGISEIKTVDYDRIKDIVAKHPEEIMNYGKPPVPER